MYVCKSLPQSWSSVCRESKRILQVQRNSVAEMRPQVWESKQKRSLQQRKMENATPLEAAGAAQLCFLDFTLPMGGSLPGCKGGGCEVCVCCPCDIPVITVTCRWLTPTVTEATRVWCCAVPDSLGCVIVRLPFLWEEIYRTLLLFGIYVVFSSKNSCLLKWEYFRDGRLAVMTWMVMFQGKHL